MSRNPVLTRRSHRATARSDWFAPPLLALPTPPSDSQRIMSVPSGSPNHRRFSGVSGGSRSAVNLGPDNCPTSWCARRRAGCTPYADPKPIPSWDWRHNERQRRQKSRSDVDTGHWLNTTTGVRHNKSCPNYRSTKRGRSCGSDEGRACGMCGG
jgi:hypothetical protein